MTDTNASLKACPSWITDELLDRLIQAVLAHTEIGLRNADDEPAVRMHKAAVKADLVEALSRTPPESSEPTAFEQQAATIAELVEALTAANGLIEAMQNQARQYVEPSGYTAFDRKRIAFDYDQEAKDSLFTDDIIYLLDGPEQREVQAKIATALAKVTP